MGRSKIDKNRILEVAYHIFASKGIQQVTVRKIAQAGNFSTQPIYSSFESINVVRLDILEKFFKYFESQIKINSTNPLLDIDLAFIKITQKNNGFLLSTIATDAYSKLIYKRLITISQIYLKHSSIVENTDANKIEALIQRNWIYMSGLLFLLNTDILDPNLNIKKEIVRNLSNIEQNCKVKTA